MNVIPQIKDFSVNQRIELDTKEPIANDFEVKVNGVKVQSLSGSEYKKTKSIIEYKFWTTVDAIIDIEYTGKMYRENIDGIKQ